MEPVGDHEGGWELVGARRRRRSLGSVERESSSAVFLHGVNDYTRFVCTLLLKLRPFHDSSHSHSPSNLPSNTLVQAYFSYVDIGGVGCHTSIRVREGGADNGSKGPQK